MGLCVSLVVVKGQDKKPSSTCSEKLEFSLRVPFFLLISPRPLYLVLDAQSDDKTEGEGDLEELEKR